MSSCRCAPSLLGWVFEFMANKAFSSYQVLQAWLETQIGSAKHVRPQGYEMPGEGTSVWPDTRARAALVVEAIPMVDLMRSRLVEYCQGGLTDLADLILVEEFMTALEASLARTPFYPTTARDIEDEARTPVVWISCAEAAEVLGCTRQYVRELVCDGVLKHTISYRRNLQLQRSEVEGYRRRVRSGVSSR